MRASTIARLGVLALTLSLGLTLARPGGVRAQQAVQPQPGALVGSQRVTGATWDFDGDIEVDSFPLTLVTVTNTNCTTPYRPGTAQAGAIIFTAALSMTSAQTDPVGVWQGNLTAFTGSMASGHVRLTSSPVNRSTDVDVTIFGLEMGALNTVFSVCLTGGGGAGGSVAELIAAGSQHVVSMGYDVTGSLSTPGPDGTTFIAISGVKVPTADGYTQWVFFFSGTTYLGTDTAVPSPQLSLAGSPGPGQIDVKYTNYAANDPLCCPTLPPVTITYTWNGTTVTPNGTPPGH